MNLSASPTVVVFRPARRAFTLIELLAVIGVIGLLAGVLIPAIGRSMRMASSAVCMHNLHAVDQALQTYRMDHGGRLPDATLDAEAPAGGGAPWFDALIPKYLSDPSVLRCPADPAAPALHAGSPQAAAEQQRTTSSYGINDFIRVAGFSDLDRHEPRRPIETLLVADLGPDHPAAVAVGSASARRSSGRLPWDDGFDPGTSGLTYSWLTDRHFGHINVVTIGGAARQVPTTALMEERIRSYYGKGASGGCPLCVKYQAPHYSFAESRIYWWTGPPVTRD